MIELIAFRVKMFAMIRSFFRSFRVIDRCRFIARRGENGYEKSSPAELLRSSLWSFTALSSWWRVS
jgi:hypothetical protein